MREKAASIKWGGFFHALWASLATAPRFQTGGMLTWGYALTVFTPGYNPSAPPVLLI